MGDVIVCPSCDGTGEAQIRRGSTSFSSSEPVMQTAVCSACAGRGVGRPSAWEELRAYYQEPIRTGNEIFDQAAACARTLSRNSSTVLLSREYEFMEDGREGSSYYQRGWKRQTAFCLHPDGSLGAFERSLPSQNRWVSPEAWSDWKPAELQDVSDFLIEFDFVATWTRCSDGWCDDDGWLDRGDDVGTLARSHSIEPFVMQSHTTSNHKVARHFVKGDGLLAALGDLST